MPPPPVPTASTAPPQELRFLRTGDDVHLAVATVGTGSTLVKATNWLNHLEFDWHVQFRGALYRFLAERVFQLIASDLPASFPPLKTLDARLNNLPSQPTPSG